MRVGYESQTEFMANLNRWQQETFCGKTSPETKNIVSTLIFRALCVNITGQLGLILIRGL